LTIRPATSRVVAQTAADVLDAAEQEHRPRVVEIERIGVLGQPGPGVLALAERQLLGAEPPVPRAKVGVVGLLAVDARGRDRRVLAAPPIGEPALGLCLVVLAGEDLDQQAAVPVEATVEQLAAQLGSLVLGQEPLAAAAAARPAQRQVDRAILGLVPAGVAAARRRVRRRAGSST
jgi:hypothetical protein